MDWQFTVYLYMYFLTGVVTLITAWINWRRRREPGLAELSLALLFVSLWSFVTGLEMTAVGRESKLFWIALEYAVVDIFSIFILLFALHYYRLSAWLTPVRRQMLWALPVLDVALVLTNPWHHLIWTNLVLGLPGSNVIFYEHGPVYYVSVAYQSALIMLAITVFGYQALHQRGRERFFAALIAVSLLIPFFSSLLFVFWPTWPAIINLMPLSFSLSALLISWITFEDLHHQVAAHTAQLETVISTLQAEIRARQQLETTLRQTQNRLSTRLAEQSHTLTGLYNLIVMAGQPSEPTVLLQEALENIRRVLQCQAVCFYRLEHDFLQLVMHDGLPAAARQSLQHLPIDWLIFGFDVRVDLNIPAAADLPAAITHSGYGAGMFKWVSLVDKIPGAMGAFWAQPANFAVEDIAMFGALTDGLGVILENSRLRQSVAENAIQEERRRLARDLHDSVTQSLHSLVLSAETANSLRQTRPERLEKPLLHLAESARQALKEMRLLLYELQLAPPQEVDLVEALQARLDTVERRAGVKAQLVVAQGACWPKAWNDELYPIAIETLNNALKHARASQVEVRLQGCAAGFEMCISDDGRGFDPHQTHGGMGLPNLIERARRLGGQVMIESTIGQGTRVSLIIKPGPASPTPNPER